MARLAAFVEDCHDRGLSDDMGHLEQRLGLSGKVAVVVGGAAGLGRA